MLMVFLAITFQIGKIPNHATSQYNVIHPYPILVATGSFSPKRGIPVKFCFDFNHFKSIFMRALLHSKTLKYSFLNNFRLLFHMLPTEI